MRFPSARRSRESGSVMLLVTLLLPVLIIPMVGLAIDASVARLVQIKLQAAVDGAALGAGRLLGTPAIPKTMAEEFLAANFRTDNSPGTWGAHDLTSTVTYTNDITKKIDITATALVPLLFLRVIGWTDATVAATGSATRTDSRVILIIDRSTSMNSDDGTGLASVITDAKNDAKGFVQKFTESADEFGLVVFDGSGAVAYPALNPNWDPTTTATSTGGPDSVFMDAANPHNILKQIGDIVADPSKGQTATADALWLAYIELQKAHLQEIKKFGVDNMVNQIVLLTDGLPQAISVWPNNPADNAIKSGSGCVNKTSTTTNIFGWIGVSRPFGSSTPDGLYQLASRDPAAAHDSVFWAQHGAADIEAVNPDTVAGCGGFKVHWSPPPVVVYLGDPAKTDFSRIPAQDMWGNSMACPGGVCAYKTESHFVDASGNAITNQLNTGLTFDKTQVTSGDHWALSFWNATDDAARRIRADVNKPNRLPADTSDMKVAIHVIGYSGNGGLDQGLLMRLANVTGQADYNATQASGVYVRAGNKAALEDAFNTVYMAILRLAK